MPSKFRRARQCTSRGAAVQSTGFDELGYGYTKMSDASHCRFSSQTTQEATR